MSIEQRREPLINDICVDNCTTMTNKNIEQSIIDLEYYIDGLYRDSIEEKEHYRELVSEEFKTLKDLLSKKMGIEN